MLTNTDLSSIARVINKKMERLIAFVDKRFDNLLNSVDIFSKKLDGIDRKLDSQFYDYIKIILERQKQLEDKVEILEKKLNETLRN